MGLVEGHGYREEVTHEFGERAEELGFTEPPKNADGTYLVAWRCSNRHMTVASIRHNHLIVPKCPKCHEPGRRGRACSEGWLGRDAAEAVANKKIVGVVESLPGAREEVMEHFTALLGLLTVRNAGGAVAVDRCAACVEFPHKGVRACECACHAAREFMERVPALPRVPKKESIR